VAAGIVLPLVVLPFAVGMSTGTEPNSFRTVVSVFGFLFSPIAGFLLGWKYFSRHGSKFGAKSPA
jgi:hypothetical protein